MFKALKKMYKLVFSDAAIQENAVAFARLVAERVQLGGEGGRQEAAAERLSQQ